MSIPFFVTLLPWLSLIWFLQKILKNVSGSFRVLKLCASAIIAGIILEIPFRGLSLVYWINSFVSNVSIPLLGIVLIKIIETTFNRKIFSAGDWKISSIFGIIASVVLYPSALGLTRIDTYSWGWTHNELVTAITLITIFLLWKKNGFGILLLLALLGFAFQLQASTNLWDYLIDPIYGTCSIAISLQKIGFKRLIKKTRFKLLMDTNSSTSYFNR